MEMRQVWRVIRKLKLRIRRYVRGRKWLDATIIGLVTPALLLGGIVAIKKGSAAIVDESNRQVQAMTMAIDEDEYGFSSFDEQHFYSSLSEPRAHVLRTGDILSSWKRIDPVVRGKIWGQTLYPATRNRSESEEVERILKLVKLDEKYKNTSHSFEMLSRTYVNDDIDSAKLFVREYRRCIDAGQCEGYDFYEKVSSNINDIYTKPAAEVLLSGQCARAKYLLRDALELFDELELPVYAGTSQVNSALIAAVISQSRDCQQGVRNFQKQMSQANTGEPEISEEDLLRVSRTLASFKLYSIALGAYREGMYVDAYQLLDGIASDKSLLSDLARLIQARCVFATLQPDGQTDFGNANEAAGLLVDIKSRMWRKSLVGDVEEYMDAIISTNGEETS